VNQVTRTGLLSTGDPAPVRIAKPAGLSPFLLIGDHAGNLVPRQLASLGLPTEALQRHIAWDIGVADLGLGLSAALDAVFVSQSYSRLVVDCNRDPGSAEATPAISDGVAVPGNVALAAAEGERRVREIHAPYQAAIGAEIRRRENLGQPTILVSLHSFTPAMGGVERPWQVGVLHDGRDDSFALALLAALRCSPGLVVGDNEPYRMDNTDYTVPHHAFGRGLAYVELEIRQDLLQDQAGVRFWVTLLAGLMEQQVHRA
jgi:predicted N-formylglutamate amidohydrolase